MLDKKKKKKSNLAVNSYLPLEGGRCLSGNDLARADLMIVDRLFEDSIWRRAEFVIKLSLGLVTWGST